MVPPGQNAAMIAWSGSRGSHQLGKTPMAAPDAHIVFYFAST
jgi:hypothetical protein